MQWIYNYQIFLFDLDGTLVDTESLHYEAYRLMCKNRGLILPWDFKAYSKRAHYSSVAVRDGFYEIFPELAKVSWDELYKEKKQIYLDLLEDKGVELMPGVEKLLIALDSANITRSVVTHSPKEQTEYIARRLPILKTIPHWITREHYSKMKPDPDSYKTALAYLRKNNEKAIGFEDVPRGLQALFGVDAEPVLISEFIDTEDLKSLRAESPKSFTHSPNFTHFCDTFS